MRKPLILILTLLLGLALGFYLGWKRCAEEFDTKSKYNSIELIEKAAEAGSVCDFNKALIYSAQSLVLDTENEFSRFMLDDLIKSRDEFDKRCKSK